MLINPTFTFIKNVHYLLLIMHYTLRWLLGLYETHLYIRCSFDIYIRKNTSHKVLSIFFLSILFLKIKRVFGISIRFWCSSDWVWLFYPMDAMELLELFAFRAEPQNVLKRVWSMTLGIHLNTTSTCEMYFIFHVIVGVDVFEDDVWRLRDDKFTFFMNLICSKQILL